MCKGDECTCVCREVQGRAGGCTPMQGLAAAPGGACGGGVMQGLPGCMCADFGRALECTSSVHTVLCVSCCCLQIGPPAHIKPSAGKRGRCSTSARLPAGLCTAGSALWGLLRALQQKEEQAPTAFVSHCVLKGFWMPGSVLVTHL